MSDVPTAELLATYAATLAELRERGVFRSATPAPADAARWQVARAFGVELEPTGRKSYDLVLADGERVLVLAGPAGGRSEPVASWGFDLAVLVVLAADGITVERVVQLPRAAVQASAERGEGGTTIPLDSSTLEAEGSVDLTAAVRAAG